jgi:tetratricopeptide (TPR) repeat protein
MVIYLRKLKNIIGVFLFSLLLGGCQNGLKLNDELLVKVDDLYLDQQFPTYKSYNIETEEDIFLLDDKMRLMVKNKLKPIHDPRMRSVKLLKHIFDQENIALAYSSGANVSAREAYHNQQANCLSLTIMAYSLAREANLNVDFQDITIPEYWVRDGDNNMLSGHVNLIITKIKEPNQLLLIGNNTLTIDFDPVISKKSFPSKIINKNTVVAMYYTNKGGQALFDDELDKAYAYFKAATKVDPSFSPAWGNLGVLYRKVKHDDYAMINYRHAISLNNKNYNTMSNMSIILNEQGKFDQVKRIKKILHKKRHENPYYHALLADEAFYRGHHSKAIKHYRRAILLANNIHEFHFGMAKIYYAMNDHQRAEKSLKKAIVYNKNPAIGHRYIAKMNVIKQENHH